MVIRLIKNQDKAIKIIDEIILKHAKWAKIAISNDGKYFAYIYQINNPK